NLAGLYSLQSFYEQARSHAQAALAYARRQDAPHALHFSMSTLAAIEYEMGLFESAQPLLEEALQLSRALDNKFNQVNALDGLALLALALRGDEAESQALFEEAVKITRELDEQPQPSLLMHMGSIALSRGE